MFVDSTFNVPDVNPVIAGVADANFSGSSCTTENAGLPTPVPLTVHK